MNKLTKHGFTIGNIIQIIILTAGIIWAAAVLQSDVDDNAAWNKRQDIEHMRKDVGEIQFRAIREQLDRIENKIEE